MDTLIWCVKMLGDGTIVSGDSTGSLKIWESQFWSLTQSFQVHKADILCLAVQNVPPRDTLPPLTARNNVNCRANGLYGQVVLIGRRCNSSDWGMGNGLMWVERHIINMMFVQ